MVQFPCLSTRVVCMLLSCKVTLMVAPGIPVPVIVASVDDSLSSYVPFTVGSAVAAGLAKSVVTSSK